jgi:membrane associated rhomboid family serine protease
MPASRSFRVPDGPGFTPGFGGRAPADLIAILAVVFATYAMQFFASTAGAVEALRLDSSVWRAGQLWRLATFPLAGYGPASAWILLELLVLYWFSRDLRTSLGTRRLWSLLAVSAVAAGVAAVAADAAAAPAGGPLSAAPYSLVQGQRALLAIAVAAFASRHADAIVYLFFVLPVRAGAFVWFGIAIAFVGFLATKDVAGLAGLWTATAVAFLRARPRGGRPPLERAVLRWRERWLRWRLDRLRRRSRLRVLDGGRGPGRGADTVN